MAIFSKAASLLWRLAGPVNDCLPPLSGRWGHRRERPIRVDISPSGRFPLRLL